MYVLGMLFGVFFLFENHFRNCLEVSIVTASDQPDELVSRVQGQSVGEGDSLLMRTSADWLNWVELSQFSQPLG